MPERARAPRGAAHPGRRTGLKSKNEVERVNIKKGATMKPRTNYAVQIPPTRRLACPALEGEHQYESKAHSNSDAVRQALSRVCNSLELHGVTRAEIWHRGPLGGIDFRQDRDPIDWARNQSDWNQSGSFRSLPQAGRTPRLRAQE